MKAMKEIILKPKIQPKESIEAEVINPDIFAGKNIDEIGNLDIFHGNRKETLKDFFDVSGTKIDDAADIRIVIDGDVSRTKRIGENMNAGEILIKGDADMYVGLKMSGGRIIVEGNTDSFTGQQMVGGELIIKGDTKDYLGSSYRGDWRGMKGGSIIVEGNAGCEVGEFMVGGKIHIKGDCGPFAGVHMKKGLIIIEGQSSGRAGAQMTGGNIILMKNTKLIPSFVYAGKEEDIEIDGVKFSGEYSRYTGDHAEMKANGNLYKK